MLLKFCLQDFFPFDAASNTAFAFLPCEIDQQEALVEAMTVFTDCVPRNRMPGKDQEADRLRRRLVAYFGRLPVRKVIGGHKKKLTR